MTEEISSAYSSTEKSWLQDATLSLLIVIVGALLLVLLGSPSLVASALQFYRARLSGDNSWRLGVTFFIQILVLVTVQVRVPKYVHRGSGQLSLAIAACTLLLANFIATRLQSEGFAAISVVSFLVSIGIVKAMIHFLMPKGADSPNLGNELADLLPYFRRRKSLDRIRFEIPMVFRIPVEKGTWVYKSIWKREALAPKHEGLTYKQSLLGEAWEARPLEWSYDTGRLVWVARCAELTIQLASAEEFKDYLFKRMVGWGWTQEDIKALSLLSQALGPELGKVNFNQSKTSKVGFDDESLIRERFTFERKAPN